MRVFQGFKLPKELVDKLEEFSKQTGKNKTQIVEEALNQYLNQGINDGVNELNLYKTQIELLHQQNKQMATTLQAFNLLLEEKDKRIQELKDTIGILKQAQIKSEEKQNQKKLWRRLFGR